MATVNAVLRDLAGDANPMTGRLPFVAIVRWCELVGVSDPFRLVDLVRALEDARAANDVDGEEVGIGR